MGRRANVEGKIFLGRHRRKSAARRASQHVD
jgi:hypothetical protein